MESRLFGIVHDLLCESGIRNDKKALNYSISLKKHLGLDSIACGELFRRIEDEFHIVLPNHVMYSAETLQDVANAISNANNQIKFDKTQVKQLEKTHIDPSKAHTLCDVLLLHASATPGRVHAYIQNEDNIEKAITYQDLLKESLKIADYLNKKGIQKSETVGIMLPTSASFLYSFFGVLLAGGVPVPVYPPARINHLEDYVKKEGKILSNASIRFLITFNQTKLIHPLLKSLVPSLKSVLAIETLLEGDEPITFVPPPVNTHDIALIQYTSGSTMDPKGVVLTHLNILANIRAYGEAIQITSNDVCVSWLPLYHDLGLIGNWLGSLYFGVPLVLFSPLDFLNRPEQWLWAIHRYRGTISAAPNFGYELCVNKIRSNQLEGLDLSSWRIAVNGAEVIRPATIEKFYNKFAACGYKRETMLPVYGLAETTLGLTATPLNRGVRIDTINRSVFEKNHRAEPWDQQNKGNDLEFVSCGKPIPRHTIQIVDAHGQTLPERCVGEIQFLGPSSLQEYYKNAEASKAAFHNGWWDTGDLGYIADGELFVTGRKKDQIIKAGRNFMPADIEHIVTQISGVRAGCVIAFSVDDTKKSAEQLIIVAETNEKMELQLLEKEVRFRVNEALDIMPDEIVLLPPRSIPKTSSGKLQRSECKKRYLENNLNKTKIPVWLQFLKLIGLSCLFKLKSASQLIEKFLYTLYITMWLLPTFIIVWFLILFSSKSTSTRIIRYWAQFIFFISLCPLKVEKKAYLRSAPVQIFVANHASYLDSFLLMSVLPENVCLVGKNTLLKIPVLKTFLKKLNYLAIDKLDESKALESIEIIKTNIKNGKSILFFPEGTFGYAEGLRPFKLGAFKIAVDMEVPICPIAISGLRYALRGNSFLFKWHSLNVVCGEPIFAGSREWNEVVKLKQHAYSFILEHIGEPKLDFIIGELSASKSK